MEEQCIRYIKPANVYRYCCSWGAWPISREQANETLSTWVFDKGWQIEIVENQFVKVFAPVEKKKED